jgi:hypothetical protein
MIDQHKQLLNTLIDHHVRQLEFYKTHAEHYADLDLDYRLKQEITAINSFTRSLEMLDKHSK